MSSNGAKAAAEPDFNPLMATVTAIAIAQVAQFVPEGWQALFHFVNDVLDFSRASI
ncbi:hypothetical protein KO516_20120 [Citreicella sp. C3M06]|uniref:hypothetical protein n=1 Tax=Citreicella sp. C3M06 TaxID=2841564 RepID=UPI001C0823B6|nr:hypothetical protein [Citreicella sp. C3M06]MBU2963090.1 hypothetical protein [Citreicella sp. C3M06]